MTNTNIREISTKAAYDTIIEEAFHIAKWQYERSERVVYFKLMRDINSNIYYKLRTNYNSEKFNEILDYLYEVYKNEQTED